MKVIIFNDNHRYAVNVDHVVEIAKVDSVEELPNAPDYMLGVANIRGKSLIVIDVQQKLHGKRTTEDASHVIIVRSGPFIVGLSGNIEKMFEVRGEQLSMLQEIKDEGKQMVRGIFYEAERAVNLLNLEALIKNINDGFSDNEAHV